MVQEGVKRVMIENVLKNMDESVISIAELKQRLANEVNLKKLIIILKHLEESNKIAVTSKGVTWIHNTNQKLRQAIEL